jgi:hypothetical protein
LKIPHSPVVFDLPLPVLGMAALRFPFSTHIHFHSTASSSPNWYLNHAL